MKVLHFVPRIISKIPTRGSQSRVLCISQTIEEFCLVETVGPNKIFSFLEKRINFLGDGKPIAMFAHFFDYFKIRAHANDADIIIIEFPWPILFLMGLRKRIIYSSHNVEKDKFLSYAKALNKKPMLRLSYVRLIEQYACRKADTIIAVSNVDKARFISLYNIDANKIWVIQNGSSTVQFNSINSDIKNERKDSLGVKNKLVAIFLGGTNAPPNQHGCRLIFEIASHFPEIQFFITGFVLEKKDYKNIKILGNVSNIEDVLSAADFALCPIIYGGGTKVKILDCLGYGLPTITFSESVIGLPNEISQRVLISPSTKEGLIDTIKKFLISPRFYIENAKIGKDYILNHMSWMHSSTRLKAEIVSKYSTKNQMSHE